MTSEQRKVESIKRQLRGMGAFLPGSLSKQYNVCGNPTCRCKDPKHPRRHGPYWQLSLRSTAGVRPASSSQANWPRCACACVVSSVSKRSTPASSRLMSNYRAPKTFNRITEAHMIVNTRHSSAAAYRPQQRRELAVQALAGADTDARRQLLDFVIESLRQREHLRPHRIQPVRVMLENQRDLLLAFAAEIDAKLIAGAHELGVHPADLRQLFNIRANERTSETSAGRDQPLKKQLGEKFDAADQAALKIIADVVRASSVIENINSRLRCYFFLRRQIGPGYLDLLRFFLNHRRFMRSEHPERVDKSPSELLSGEPHPHWLELLGFVMFKRAA